MNYISKITPHLYISNLKSVNNYNIKKYKFKCILTIIESDKIIKSVQKIAQDNNITHYYIKIDDIPKANLSKYFDSTFDIILDNILNKQNILIHCYAGVSRSATIIIAFLLKIQHIIKKPISVNDMISFVKSKRNIINPNLGFIKQLDKYNNFYYIINVFRKTT
jgi:dual specificity phosphatase 12